MGFITREGIENVYGVMILVGLILPTLSLLLGQVDLMLPDAGLDLDGDGLFDGHLSFNLSSFLLACTVLGAMGLLLNNYVSLLLSFVISAICGFIFYKCFCKFIVAPLKKNEAQAENIRYFKNQIGVVKTQIKSGATGEVVLDGRIGKITYFAKLNTTDFSEEETIKPGTKVLVTDVDDNVLIVTRYF